MIGIPPDAEFHAALSLSDGLGDLVDILDPELRVDLTVRVHLLQGRQGSAHLRLHRTVDQVAIPLEPDVRVGMVAIKETLQAGNGPQRFFVTARPMVSSTPLPSGSSSVKRREISSTSAMLVGAAISSLSIQSWRTHRQRRRGDGGIGQGMPHSFPSMVAALRATGSWVRMSRVVSEASAS